MSKALDTVIKSGPGSITITDGIELMGILTMVIVLIPFLDLIDDKSVSVLTG